MPTTQRQPLPALIAQLLADPGRYQLLQAIRLLRDWLPDPARRLHFHNSLELSFAAAEIEAISLEYLADDGWPQVHITTPIFSLLGAQGVLPVHYTEALLRHEQQHGDSAPRAFLDSLAANAPMRLYRAWAAHRMECDAEAAAGYQSAQHALAGSWPSGAGRLQIAPETVSRYAALLRQRHLSAGMLEHLLSDYFSVPFQVVTHLSARVACSEEDRSLLGKQNCRLGQGAMLGATSRRADLWVELRIGPLNTAQYEEFLPHHGSAYAALRQLLQLTALPPLCYRVRLVLRAADVQPVQLGRQGGVRLGWECFLPETGPRRDRDDLSYDIHPS
ncbi:type VI secretion system baseplate subunit TssG [Oxalobacteraceae bacterium A2-2]